MNRAKLAASLTAAVFSMGGATYLAQPLEAAEMKPCTALESAYAQGYADASCEAKGYDYGVVSGCVDNGDGTISFDTACYKKP